MRKVLLTIVVAMMATVSVCAQRVKRYDTATLSRAEEIFVNTLKEYYSFDVEDTNVIS